MVIKKYTTTYVKHFFFIALATFLPSKSNDFRLGLENIPDSFIQKSKNARIGLITNQTGKDQQGHRNLDILLKRGINITAILAPEHGFNGTILAEIDVPDNYDKETEIPILSLYEHKTGKKISEKIINNLDILIFDIQDSGMRHYTYISTLFMALDTAAQFNKQFIVLDRPNPLGGLMEGPLVDVTCQSFVSIAPIPLRHALTVGELAWFFNKHLLKKEAKLHVIRMKNYKRTMNLHYLPFNALSPNIATIQSCYGYSFLGLLGEITPFEIGTSSDKAFQLILLPESIQLPKKKWNELHTLLQKHGIESNSYKTFIAAKKQMYTGLHIAITDINKLSSFTTFMDILRFSKKTKLNLTFSNLFDKAVGTKKVRTYYQGITKRKNLITSINTDLNDFLEKARSSLMYEPIPKPVMLSY
ncbi:DUF1343 domain-containing protein [Candidatus Dependentiae bacterium]|nr:MAG: DUF1343 domain-containing protein [Candidatus Dependentiae bacterium]